LIQIQFLASNSSLHSARLLRKHEFSR